MNGTINNTENILHTVKESGKSHTKPLTVMLSLESGNLLLRLVEGKVSLFSLL